MRWIRTFGPLLGLVLVGLVAAPAAAVPDATSSRLAGGDRYGTALLVSANDAFDGATRLVVVGSAPGALPDALVAGSLGVPVLPTPADALHEQARQAVLNHKAELTQVLIVGGTAAVGPVAEQQLRDLGVPVARVAGADRYATAVAVARLAPEANGRIQGKPSAIVASGESFADALAAGAFARIAGIPMLLTSRASASPATVAELDRRGITHVLLAGGTAAVSDAARDGLGTSTRQVGRVTGADRASTAAELAHFAFTVLGLRSTAGVLVNGFSPADGITGGALAGALRAPLVLADSPDVLPPRSVIALDEQDGITHIWAIGGTSVLSDKVLKDAEAATEDIQDD